MNSISEVLNSDEDEPPLSVETENPYGLHKFGDVVYALDDLLADAASITSNRDYSPLDVLGSMLTAVYDLGSDLGDYGVNLSEEEADSDPYAAVKVEEEVAPAIGSVVDFTDYLTRRYVDTSVSFAEGSMEEVQDYLQYLGSRNRARWGSN